MKKIFLLPILLTLTACNRPSSETELLCKTAEVYNPEKIESFTAHVKTYADRAILSIDGKSETLVEIKSDEYEPGYLDIRYEGTLPGTTKEIVLSLALDMKNNVIVQYDIFPATPADVGYYCIPTAPEHQGTEWSANVPFKK
jgi:hypothetical protein